MAPSEFEPVAVSAARGKMGTWDYYTTALPLSEISRRVRSVAAIHTSKNLSEMVQRSLTNRAKDIARYLRDHEDRFFGSLVIGCFGGQPEWFSITLDSESVAHPPGLVARPRGTVGVLQFRGTEILFPLDGQHRVEGIKRALATGFVNGDEEVPVVLVGVDLTVYPTSGPSKGMVRARRLFTHLNRYAKPVQKFDILALDEDHTMAIAFRRFLEANDEWSARLKPTQDKAITIEDTAYVVPVLTAYDLTTAIAREALSDLWKNEKSTWAEFVQVRPSDNIIEEFERVTASVMTSIRQEFPPIADALTAADPATIIQNQRHANGGHIMFRSVGWNILSGLVTRFMKDGLSIQDAVKRAAKMPTTLQEAPWRGVIFDPDTGAMRAATSRQTLAREIVECMAGYEVKPRGNVRPSLSGKQGWDYVEAKCQEETQVTLRRQDLGTL